MPEELQVMMSGFGLDLFTQDVVRESGKALNLQELEIKDPYPGQSKTLWLRYCRAGDGQRRALRGLLEPMPGTTPGSRSMPREASAGAWCAWTSTPSRIRKGQICSSDCPSRTEKEAFHQVIIMNWSFLSLEWPCHPRQEFVNCLTSSPLLSETLRQFSTTDNDTKNVPEGVSIKLDVTIADPTKA